LTLPVESAGSRWTMWVRDLPARPWDDQSLAAVAISTTADVHADASAAALQIARQSLAVACGRRFAQGHSIHRLSGGAGTLGAHVF